MTVFVKRVEYIPINVRLVAQTTTFYRKEDRQHQNSLLATEAGASARCL